MPIDSQPDRGSLELEKVRALLSRVKANFSNRPFQPHSLFQNGHAQTLAAFAWPRRLRFRLINDEERLFDIAPNVQVLGHCRWQKNPTAHATVIIWHGIEGSSSSKYMLGTAEKAFLLGFNVVRMNLRTCGGTEHLTPSIYHGGLTEDLREVVKQLIECDQLTRIFLVGFSLGGNMVLKLAGEYGANPPKEVLGVVAVSPSIDLNASAELVKQGSNWIYEQDFVWRLKRRIRTKHKLYPDRYDISGLGSVRTLREFDNRFTARAHGFADAEDYYFKASSIRVIEQIRILTLIIHAQDDPFIPFTPMLDPGITNNPYILLVDPERGGHVAFVSAKSKRSRRATNHRQAASEQPSAEAGSNSSLISDHSSLREDRFWAENRVAEFCRLANDVL